MGVSNKYPIARTWWIDPGSDLEDPDDTICSFDAYSDHPRQGDLLWQSELVEVIEKSAYDRLALELADIKTTWQKEEIDVAKREARLLQTTLATERRILELEATVSDLEGFRRGLQRIAAMDCRNKGCSYCAHMAKIFLEGKEG